MRDRLRAFTATLAGEREELTVLAGLACLTAGVWSVLGPGWAAICAGVVLLWIALPSRAAFIERTPGLKPPTRRMP